MSPPVAIFDTFGVNLAVDGVPDSTFAEDGSATLPTAFVVADATRIDASGPLVAIISCAVTSFSRDVLAICEPDAGLDGAAGDFARGKMISISESESTVVVGPAIAFDGCDELAVDGARVVATGLPLLAAVEDTKAPF